jgi:trehalose 6-phosphate synthase
VEDRRKLIVVSNRGPVSYRRGDGGERIEQRGQGGLVTALRPLVAHHDVTWVASAMTDEDRAVAAEAGGSALLVTGRTGETYRLRLVTHDHQTFDRFYNRFANPTLWFLQHYLWNLIEEPVNDQRLHDAWSSYGTANESFAAAVLEDLDREPDTAVWFHDYHLYLAPRLVRRARPDALLSHFVHIPWPGPDYWTILPEPVRVAIHDGLLANDVVGFHTDRWRENFLFSAARILGAEVDHELGTVEHDGRRTLVTARAISVDPAEFEELADSEEVRERERGLEEISGERLIVRVDRTDPSKNIVRGFQAFELYLERHPDARGRVTMLGLLDPSRQNIPHYAAYLEEIQSVVRTVNRRFGSDAWQPIVLVVRDDFPRSLAAYKRYDVLFVNAIFDGMNLVAKEAPLVNERDGVLLLSENTGAHDELAQWSVVVNPFDVVGQAEAIHAALELSPADRRARIEAIRAHVREHDIESWLSAQLADLDAVSPVARS